MFLLHAKWPANCHTLRVSALADSEVAPKELNIYSPGCQPGVKRRQKPMRFGAIFCIGRDITWKGYYHPAKIVTKRASSIVDGGMQNDRQNASLKQ
jgi:hypothetical protein